ncbi:hypothetical protein V8E53_006382 [Lactarius tabidus]
MIPSTSFAMMRRVAQTCENYVSVTSYNYTNTKIQGFQGTRQPPSGWARMERFQVGQGEKTAKSSRSKSKSEASAVSRRRRREQRARRRGERERERAKTRDERGSTRAFTRVEERKYNWID